MKTSCTAWAVLIPFILVSSAHADGTIAAAKKGGSESLIASINRIADDVDETTNDVRELRTEVREARGEIRDLKGAQLKTVKQLEEEIRIRKQHEEKFTLVTQRLERAEKAEECTKAELAKSRQLAAEDRMMTEQNLARAQQLEGLVVQANKRAGYNRGPRGRLGPLGAMGAFLGEAPILKRFFHHTP